MVIALSEKHIGAIISNAHSGILEAMDSLGFLGPLLKVALFVIALLSGAISVFREVQSLYFPTRGPQLKSFWTYVRVACFISFMILLYDDQAKLREQDALLNSPALSIGFDQIVTGDLPQPDRPVLTGIRIIASVRNTGTPSIADGWELVISIKGKQDLFLVPQYVGPKAQFQMNSRGQTLTIEGGNDNLYDISFRNPIQRGAKIRGALLFLTQKITLQDLRQPETVLTLVCSDVNGREIRVAHALNATDQPYMYYPGTTAPEIKSPENGRYSPIPNP